MDLLALAVAPVAIVLFWIYQKDRYEPEPLSLIFKIMVFGALACVPAAVLEFAVEPFLLPDNSGLLRLLLFTIFGIGLVEEACKYWMLKRTTWRSPFFTQRFDGIVYAVAASLGFAVLENLLYVFSGGHVVGLLRAVTAIPMHSAFGVLMGVAYGRARYAAGMAFHHVPMSWVPLGPPPVPGQQPYARNVMSDGFHQPDFSVISEPQPHMHPLAGPAMNSMSAVSVNHSEVNRNLVKALWIPTALHGVYNFFAMAAGESGWFVLGLVGTLVGTVAYAIRVVVREARHPR